MYEQKINEYIKLIDESLNNYFLFDNTNIVYDSAMYSLFSSGKKLRPLLFFATCDLFSNDNIKNSMPFACAIEMIHTYSLIHDDLPSIDNDDFRRGKLSNHKVFGENIALLSGDFLLNKAFEILSRNCLENFSIQNVKAMHEISICGLDMICGQAIDVVSSNKKIDFDTLSFIHKNKTAALIKGSLKSAAILSTNDEEIITLLEDIGYKIGLAFQIKDDILDITSSQEILGKPLNSDIINKKNTFVTLFSLDEAISKYEKISNEILSIINMHFGKNSFFCQIIENLINRIN